MLSHVDRYTLKPQKNVTSVTINPTWLIYLEVSNRGMKFSGSFYGSLKTKNDKTQKNTFHLRTYYNKIFYYFKLKNKINIIKILIY